MTADPLGPGESGAPGISIDAALTAASTAHRDTTRLIRMLTVLGEPGDVPTVLDRALYTLSDLFEIDVVVALTPIGAGTYQLLGECGLGEDLAAAVTEWPAQAHVDSVLGSLEPVAVTGSDVVVPAALSDLGVQDALWLPAGSEEGITVLGLLRCHERRPDSSELEVLRIVAHRLGVALEAARHRHRIEWLGRLGHRVSAHLEAREVLREAIEALPEIFSAHASTVALLQEDGTVRFPVDFGVAELRGHVRPADQLASWPSISRGEAFLLSSDQPEILRRWSGMGTESSVLAVPIRSKDALLGALYLVRNGGRPFGSGARDALMLFSAQLGAALDNARLYEALRSSQAQLQLITDSISDLVAVFDEDGRCSYASPSHRSELGIDPADLLGVSLTDLMDNYAGQEVAPALIAAADAEGSPHPVEYQAVLVAGRPVWLETFATRLGASGEGDRRLVLSSRVIDRRKALEEQLRHAATTDELTGLLNRRALLEQLDAALVDMHATTGATGRLALLFLDLDRFKTVNDSLGHAAGDRLLMQVAARLRACLDRTGHGSDLIARLGGDEFVLLLRGLSADSATVIADALADAVLAELNRPVCLDGREFEITASIGIVLPAPLTAPSASEVLRSADAAMYQAKAGGRARWATYDEEMDRTQRRRLDLAADLRGAAGRDELHLHYQPVVDGNATVVGFEALLRWRHPDHGDVSPLDMIPLAEETGLIGPIGRWVLRTACRQGAAWNAVRQAAGLAPLTMAVNLSPAQIEDSLPAAVLEEIADAGLAPECLLLEVTETAYMNPTSEAPVILARLRAEGVRTAIDDFGTGFSSFDRLRRFPADVLKIDRSFVAALDDGPAAGAIVRAMIDLSLALGSHAVAEGVERPDQAAALLAAGCARFQGWLYAPARPAAELTGLVDGTTSLGGAPRVPAARRATSRIPR